jgi:hypothetical protein
MSDRDQLYPLDQRAWLLAIGRRLRVEYDAIAEPVPPRLAALVKRKIEGNTVLEDCFGPLLALALRVRHQEQRQRGPKVYSLHACLCT